MSLTRTLVTTITLLATATGAFAASPPPRSMARLRGIVRSFSGQTLVLSTPKRPVHIQLASPLVVTLVVPAKRSQIKPGTFVGVTSVAQPNGPRRATEIHIFPESMRGMGEGDYPMPGEPRENRMTNATVVKPSSPGGSRMTNATVVGPGNATRLTLQYKGGLREVVVPPSVPIVALEPGTAGDLEPGAHAIVFATPGPNGTFVGARVLVGKNGFTPPM